MEHYLVDSESFDRGLWFVAWDGDRPAGAASAACATVSGGSGSSASSVTGGAGDRPCAAPALVRRVQAPRLPRAGLGVDAESLTGANRLYESAGMHVVRRLDFFDKQLAPSRA